MQTRYNRVDLHTHIVYIYICNDNTVYRVPYFKSNRISQKLNSANKNVSNKKMMDDLEDKW